ncbi:MAG: hypothetical protein EOP85_05940 [Verrucomicrobiaceae bacterium]|nr:MAG: hypothetical protein EOP85_05940 [Verrucomicrobiaceae bacterium]
MNRTPMPPDDDSWESDAVWNLLDQAPPRTAGARFTNDVVRAARLLPEEKPWWSRLVAPLPLAGLAGTAAVAALALFASLTVLSPTGTPGAQAVVADSAQAVAIQDIAETETLIEAADQLDDFSDNELVSLIGF